MEFYSEFGIMCSGVGRFGNVSKSIFEVHSGVNFCKNRQFSRFVFQNPERGKKRIKQQIPLNTPEKFRLTDWYMKSHMAKWKFYKGLDFWSLILFGFGSGSFSLIFRRFLWVFEWNPITFNFGRFGKLQQLRIPQLYTVWARCHRAGKNTTVWIFLAWDKRLLVLAAGIE